jgi:ABC-type phosphate/phosphonate transport system substrate-binding protein
VLRSFIINIRQRVFCFMNLASLPMYDLPELAGVTDAWWAELAAHMRREGIADVPDTRISPEDMEQHWCAPNLLLSQTCGFPLTHVLRGKVQLLCLPVYACDGCDPDGFYSSVIVVSASSKIHSLMECRNSRAVYNNDDSMSGLLALQLAASKAAAADDGSAFFGSLSRSGGHRRSLQAVADGKADVAAIDAVTFALLKKIDPDLIASLRVMGHSPKVPGLPYITSLRRSDDEVERLRTALRHAVEDKSLADVRAELLISDVTFPNPSNYNIILELEAGVSSFNLV